MYKIIINGHNTSYGSDIMFNKKNLFYTGFTIVLAGCFTIGFVLGMWKYKSDINSEATSSNVSSLSNSDEVQIKAATNIILSTIYEKSGDCIKDKEVSGKQYAGENRKQLEKSFEKDGYMVEKMTSSEVSMKRAVNRYSPNKYVLGIKGDYIAIFKTDKDGNQFIEDEATDITKIRISNLKDGDITMLTNGSKDFQFDTKEGALAKLEDYI